MISQKVLNEAKSAIKNCADIRQLEQLRVKYLGRQGVVTEKLKQIGSLPVSKRAKVGEEINLVKVDLERALASRQTEIEKTMLDQSTNNNPIDLTAPVPNRYGHMHPVSQVLDDLVRLFWQMGYEVADGPEVETEWYNFEALLVAKDHPARDSQDTFYLEGGNLPRTHTSGVQVRYMQEHEPPIRIIAPGKVYRNEDEDPRHSWVFYQIEGLVVDKGISMSHLKGTLVTMLQDVLGAETKLKLLPNYFPYTEPSVEMHGSCVICNGSGCKTCSGTGWLELGGAGMVHPQVLRNAGIDPTIYSGFAFGFGPERIASIKYGIPDVREFWRPNLKFLEQF